MFGLSRILDIVDQNSKSISDLATALLALAKRVEALERGQQDK